MFPAFTNERPFPGERHDLPVPVSHALGDRVGLVEELDRGVELAGGEHRVDRLHEQAPAVLGRLGLALEQPLRTREPAVRDRELPAALVVPRKRQRQAGRADLVPGGGVGGVRALAQADGRVELALPPRGLAVQLEVARRQLARVDAGEGRMRFLPCVPCRRFACRIETVDHLRHGDHAV